MQVVLQAWRSMHVILSSESLLGHAGVVATSACGLAVSTSLGMSTSARSRAA